MTNKIKVSFKLEDVPMIIETLEEAQNESNKYKQALLDIKETLDTSYYISKEMCVKVINKIECIVNKAIGGE